MVRKDGYFSITDACIKHCRANFLIVRPKKKFLQIFFAHWGGDGWCRGTRGAAAPPAVLLPVLGAGPWRVVHGKAA